MKSFNHSIRDGFPNREPKEKGLFIKQMAMFFAVFMFVVFGLSQSMRASTAAQIVSQINGMSVGLSAVENPTNTVIVTGTYTASTTLTLSIDGGVTVLWQANITAVSPFTGSSLFALSRASGGGNTPAVFEVGTGGVVSTTGIGFSAIATTGNKFEVIVSGTGKVQATGNDTAINLGNGAQMLLKDDAVVSAEYGTAIHATSGSTEITLSGGFVSAYPGITIQNGTSDLVIKEGGVTFGQVITPNPKKLDLQNGVLIEFTTPCTDPIEDGSFACINIQAEPASQANCIEWAIESGVSGINVCGIFYPIPGAPTVTSMHPIKK